MRRRSRIQLQSVGWRIRFSRSQHDTSLPPKKSDQEAADKQAWSLLPARASALHARSLLASKQDSPIYMCVRSFEGGTRKQVAGTRT